MTNLKRRRKEFKTDYKKRFALLKSGLPRVIFRKTNKYLIVQYVKSDNAQDKILLGIDSKVLLKYGWPKEESIKSIPAAYLTGYLFGKKILLKKLEGSPEGTAVSSFEESSLGEFFIFLTRAIVKWPINLCSFPNKSESFSSISL